MRFAREVVLLRAAIAIIALAAAIAAVIALGHYGREFFRSPSAQRPPTAASFSPDAAPASPAGSSFALFDQPRVIPDLQFIDGEGRALSLADFYGRVVLLNIWATWCVPCRKEMPTLGRLQAELGGPEFQVIALSIDRNGLSVVKPFYDSPEIVKVIGRYIEPSSVSHSSARSGQPATRQQSRRGTSDNERGGNSGFPSHDNTTLKTANDAAPL